MRRGEKDEHVCHHPSSSSCHVSASLAALAQCLFLDAAAAAMMFGPFLSGRGSRRTMSKGLLVHDASDRRAPWLQPVSG